MGLRETIPGAGHQAFLTGLIGAPIAHSASPAMHGQAADALGIRCHYQLIEIAGADAAELRALLDSIKRIGFAGINVTFPYKEAVVPLLDDLSPAARAIGAVNTIVVSDDRLVGYNTDATGFERAISGLVKFGDCLFARSDEDIPIDAPKERLCSDSCQPLGNFPNFFIADIDGEQMRRCSEATMLTNVGRLPLTPNRR